LAVYGGNEVLLTPGPVMLHERTLRAMAAQPLSHRSEAFRRLLGEVRGLLEELAGGGSALVLTGSGTLAVEAMAWSLVAPGDTALVVSHGEFGERLANSLRRRGAVVSLLEARSAGGAVSLEEALREIETRLYDVVALVYTETSMGLSYREAGKLAEAAKAAGSRVLVDAVSAFGGEPVPPPGTVDAIATASQKALAGPPGLGFVVVGEEALRGLLGRGVPPGTPSYLDLSKVARFHLERRETPYTPAVNLLYGMAEALHLIAEHGREEWIARHRRRAEKLYRSIPLEPLVASPGHRAWTLAAFRTPIPSSVLAKRLAERGIRVARGMGQLRDAVIRVSTMGWSPDNVFDDLPGIIAGILNETRR